VVNDLKSLDERRRPDADPVFRRGRVPADDLVDEPGLHPPGRQPERELPRITGRRVERDFFPDGVGRVVPHP
jgi:hypothetical protein